MKCIVLDIVTKKPLAFANLYLSDSDGNAVQPIVGTQTTADGTFVIMNPNKLYLTVRYLGYKPVTIYPVDWAQIEMDPQPLSGPQINITGDRINKFSFAAILGLLFLLFKK
jgi:hypothetical protein